MAKEANVTRGLAPRAGAAGDAYRQPQTTRHGSDQRHFACHGKDPNAHLASRELRHNDHMRSPAASLPVPGEPHRSRQLGRPPRQVGTRAVRGCVANATSSWSLAPAGPQAATHRRAASAAPWRPSAGSGKIRVPVWTVPTVPRLVRYRYARGRPLQSDSVSSPAAASSRPCSSCFSAVHAAATPAAEIGCTSEPRAGCCPRLRLLLAYLTRVGHGHCRRAQSRRSRRASCRPGRRRPPPCRWLGRAYGHQIVRTMPPQTCSLCRLWGLGRGLAGSERQRAWRHSALGPWRAAHR